MPAYPCVVFVSGFDIFWCQAVALDDASQNQGRVSRTWKMCAALLRQHHFNSFSRSISIRKQDAFQRLINYENSLDYWILIQLTFKLQIMVSFTILLCFKNEVNDSSPGFSNV